MKYFVYVFFSLLSLLGLNACYEDKSTLPGEVIPAVVIGNADTVIEAVYGKMLTVDPQVSKDEKASASLSYTWYVSIENYGSELVEIGQEEILNYQVAEIPNVRPYLLVLCVRDNDERLDYYKRWDLFVSNSFGEGLVVADTRDGGRTSDLTFVKAPQVTYGYAGEKDYTRSLYSLANEEKIEGKVNALVANVATSQSTYNLSRILVGTDRGLEALDPVSFAKIASGEELFLAAPASCAPQFISNLLGNCLVTVIDGKAYPLTGNYNYLFQSALNYNYSADQVFNGCVAVDRNGSSEVMGMSCYDEIHGYFLSVRSALDFNYNGSSSVLQQDLEPGEYVFDPGNLPGKTALEAGIGPKGEHYHLLRDKATLQDTVYVLGNISMGENDYGGEQFSINGVRKIHLGSCSEISSAVDYAFCENADVMFYATPQKLYAAVFVGSSSAAAKQWEVPVAEEKITAVQFYRQAWYGVAGNDPGTYNYQNTTHMQQILVTTYNAATGEGKVYILPIQAPATGGLGKPAQVLEGFGEITAIGTTLR